MLEACELLILVKKSVMIITRSALQTVNKAKNPTNFTNILYFVVQFK